MFRISLSVLWVFFVGNYRYLKPLIFHLYSLQFIFKFSFILYAIYALNYKLDLNYIEKSWSIASMNEKLRAISLSLGCQKFVQLTIHFHWLRSPWRRADIFRYSLSSRKFGSFVRKHRQKGEARTIAMRALQQTLFKEAIVKRLLKRSQCKVT